MWEKVNKIRRGRTAAPSPLWVDGKYVVSDVGRAEAFARVLSKNSSVDSLSAEMRAHRQHFIPTEPTHNNSTNYNQPILRSEVVAAINHVGNKDKSTGLDSVSYVMLSHLPDNFINHLWNILNGFYLTDTIPPAWREAIVITIPKPNKPRSDPGSYRPISLTSHISKIFERILNERLIHYLETNYLLPDCQAGLRKLRYTTEHIASVVELLKQARLTKIKRRAAVFFDISKATHYLLAFCRLRIA